MTLSEDLALIGIIVTGLGSMAGLIGILFVWQQVRASRRVAQGEFILRLGQLLAEHESASRLLVDGQWKPETGDKNDVAMIDMVRYMEMFYQMKVLIDYQMIEPDVFQRLFGYRLYFVVMNDYIYKEQLLKNGQWWPDTIALCKLMATYPIVDSENGDSIFKWSEFRERADRLSNKV
jgi:hypothetical protein